MYAEVKNLEEYRPQSVKGDGFDGGGFARELEDKVEMIQRKQSLFVSNPVMFNFLAVRFESREGDLPRNRPRPTQPS